MEAKNWVRIVHTMCIWDAHKSYPIKCDYRNLKRACDCERDEGGWYSKQFSGVHPFSFFFLRNELKKIKEIIVCQRENKNSHMHACSFASHSMHSLFCAQYWISASQKKITVWFSKPFDVIQYAFEIKGMNINHQIISMGMRLLWLLWLKHWMRFDEVSQFFHIRKYHNLIRSSFPNMLGMKQQNMAEYAVVSVQVLNTIRPR